MELMDMLSIQLESESLRATAEAIRPTSLAVFSMFSRYSLMT